MSVAGRIGAKVSEPLVTDKPLGTIQAATTWFWAVRIR